MPNLVRPRLVVYFAVALTILFITLRTITPHKLLDYLPSYLPPQVLDICEKCPLPSTRIVTHAPGWTIFENIYMSNGTIFIVTDEPAAFPHIRTMIATQVGADGNYFRREPTNDTMAFISPEQAGERWARGVWNVKGTTFLFNDPAKTFIFHYYHACAETIFGAWAIYSGTYSPRLPNLKSPKVPPIERAIFSHNAATEWRDSSKFSSFVLYAAFPSISLEDKVDWADRVFMTRHGESAWRFERLLLNDRHASYRGAVYRATQRMAAEALGAVKPALSALWWEPVRRSVLRVAGVPAQPAAEDKVVITYVSRQAWFRGRKLRPKDHAELVDALRRLCTRRGWELVLLDAHLLPPEEQMRAAARTTVMLGVHGNGLTHLLWMPPSPRATVIEIFYPGAFASDYDWTARARGLKHFGVWNDTSFTYPHPPHVKFYYHPGVDGDGGFQGNNIPVHGESIAGLIERRVDGAL